LFTLKSFQFSFLHHLLAKGVKLRPGQFERFGLAVFPAVYPVAKMIDYQQGQER
jgi:hypothetical protein